MAVWFWLCASAYFFLLLVNDAKEFNLDKKIQVIIKCLPILILIQNVRKKFSSMTAMQEDNHAKNVFIALCFSVVADALLVYDDDVRLFLAGLGLFLLAATFYMQAFGWTKLKFHLLPVTLVTFMSLYYYVFQVLSEVPIEIQIGCLIYTVVGQTAIWRALARVDWNDVQKGKKDDLYAAFGVISFATSDFTLAVNKFCFPVPHSGIIVMSTYYTAQFAISSAVKKKKTKM